MHEDTRVAHIVSTLNIGGLEKQVFNLVSARARATTFVICIQEGGHFSETLKELGFQVFVLDDKRGFFPKLFSLIRILKRIGPDIVHCHNLLAFLYGKIASLFLGNISTAMSKHGEAFPDDTLSQRVALRLLKYTDMIVVSNAIKIKAMELLGLNENKLIFIGNGIPIPDWEYQSKPCDGDKLIVGTVGRLVTEKRYDILLRSFAKALKSVENLQLKIVGSGYELDKLVQLAKRLGISNHVEFVGEQIDVGRYYSMFDIFILTSDTEGLPMAMLESMSYGIPVVSTNVGAIGELFTSNENILMVNRRSEDEIADCVVKLATSKELRIKLGSNSRQLMKSQYSVQNSLEQHEKLYTNILERGTANRVNTV